MDYQEYIQSDQWKEKREERLKLDGYQCVVCRNSEGLSVHHLHYDSLGNEDVQHDLVTVCNKCHRYFDTIERYQRYKKRQRKVEAIDLEVKERKDITSYGMESLTVPIDISVRSPNAQRADRRPNQQMGEVTQTDFIKTRKNR